MPKPIIIKAGTSKQKGISFPFCGYKRTLTFSFTESCKYDSGENQDDFHKLIGIGVLDFFNSFKKTPHKKWWEFHKWLSIRAGFRYNKIEDCWEVTDYCYINGVGERDATDNQIVKLKVKEIATVTTYVAKNMLVLIIEKSGEVTHIQKACKTPLFLPLFLRLNAYVGSGFKLLKDMIINTH